MYWSGDLCWIKAKRPNLPCPGNAKVSLPGVFQRRTFVPVSRPATDLFTLIFKAMKTTFLFTQTLVAGLLLAGMFAAVPAAAQERPDCTTCECVGTLMTGGCKITCCKPQTPNCDCFFFGCKVGCSMNSTDLPVLDEQNIRDFTNLLRTDVFTSPVVMNLVNDIPLYLEAYNSGSVETFYTLVERMEINIRQLTAAEKQHANQWIVARGGRPNTIP